MNQTIQTIQTFEQQERISGNAGNLAILTSESLRKEMES